MVKVLDRVRSAAAKQVLFLPHAIRQMTHPDRMISTQEVREVVENGQLVEDYPEDTRGHSCLLFGSGYRNRPIHVVCSPKDDYLAIITAYVPDPKQWSKDFMTRS